MPGLEGVQIFAMNSYCIFGRFGKMTHLIKEGSQILATAAQAATGPGPGPLKNIHAFFDLTTYS